MATTEGVRDAYSWMDNYPHAGYVDETTLADFDRWLAAEKAQAWREGHEAHRIHDRSTLAASADNPYERA